MGGGDAIGRDSCRLLLDHRMVMQFGADLGRLGVGLGVAPRDVDS